MPLRHGVYVSSSFTSYSIDKEEVSSLLLCGKDSQEDASLTTQILTSSSPGLSCYPFYMSVHTRPLQQQPHSITLYLEWLSGFVNFLFKKEKYNQQT